MYQILLIASFIFGLISPVTGQVVHTEKSRIDFKIGNMGVKTVKGTFGGMKGEIRFDTTSPASSFFDVCIDASTINTGIKKRDDHLKNEDFFDVVRYPAICFKSVQIIKTREGYTTKGKLTMHGITREVTIPFLYSQNMLKGTFSVKRLDYGIGDTGTFLVSDEVDITILCYLK